MNLFRRQRRQSEILGKLKETEEVGEIITWGTFFQGVGHEYSTAALYVPG